MRCEWKWQVQFQAVFFYSCTNTRFLESRAGAAILNRTGNSLSVETLRVGELWDRRLGFWQLLRAQLPESLDFYVKEKKNLYYLQASVGLVSVTNSFIYVLINSKGNRNWWMKMIHAQMAKTRSINIVSHLDLTSFIQKGDQSFYKWCLMCASTV